MALLLLAQPASLAASVTTATSPGARSAYASYMRARAADALGALDVASQGYAAALAAAPADTALALRAFRQAMLAGDQPLALRAARILDAARELPSDGTLLLFADAVAAADWKAAALRMAAIERQEAFAFMLPVLRGWVALGACTGEPLAALEGARAGPLAASYIAEHRAYLLLASGRIDDGIAALEAQLANAGPRAIRLRIAGAARLAELGERDRALALLAGDDVEIAAARALVKARKDLPGSVDTPAQGIAELLVRVATDMNRERATPLALSLTRLATFLAPHDSEAWATAAALLAAAGQPEAALDATAKIAPDDPLAAAARDMRVQLLVRNGEAETALAEALAAARKSKRSAAEQARVGDVYSELDRHDEAAAAYGSAIALIERKPDQATGSSQSSRQPAGQPLWALHLLRGGALEQAGQWPEAEAALRRAVALAPQEAVALNYLGYAQLERRSNLDEAQSLIEKASRLKPDDPSIADSLGWVQYLRGDLAGAISSLERAVAGEPAESTINEHLGDAYWSAGRRLEARFAWRAALVYAGTPDATRIAAKLDTGLTPELAAP